jgi:Flp pilus assembly protein TadD
MPGIPSNRANKINKKHMGQFDDLFKKHGMPEKINFGGKEIQINADAMVFSQRALDAYGTKEYEKSIVNFNNAITAHPSNQNFYTMRGTVYEDMGNDYEAEKDFRKSLELQPNNFLAAYRLGMVFFRKKDFNSAIKWLKLSYDNAPDMDFDPIGMGKNNILYVAKKLIAGNLGNFLTQVKKYNESFEYLDEAIRLDPNYPNPYMAKGLALAQIGEVQEGIKYLEKAENLGVGQATMIIQMLKGV